MQNSTDVETRNLCIGGGSGGSGGSGGEGGNGEAEDGEDYTDEFGADYYLGTPLRRQRR